MMMAEGLGVTYQANGNALVWRAEDSMEIDSSYTLRMVDSPFHSLGGIGEMSIRTEGHPARPAWLL